MNDVLSKLQYVTIALDCPYISITFRGDRCVVCCMHASAVDKPHSDHVDNLVSVPVAIGSLASA